MSYNDAPMVDVTAEQLAAIHEILHAQVPGVEVWAFGSRVHGPRKPHSDLDLAVLSDSPLPLARLAMLEEAFADSDLPFRVDVIDWARTTEEFRAILRRSHAVLVEGSGDRIRA